jgi:hypothetical protein
MDGFLLPDDGKPKEQGNTMTKIIKNVRKAAAARIGGKVHKTEPLVHVAYLTAAFAEGHGIYAAAAITCAVIALLGIVLGDH